MQGLDIQYICTVCFKESSQSNTSMVCECCGGHLKGVGAPGINGTRDGFGIKKIFRDDENGKEIDNWKVWEKAGYRNPLEVTKDHDMKEKIKAKINRSKNK